MGSDLHGEGVVLVAVGRALSPDERKLFTPRSVQVTGRPDGTVLVSWEAPISPLPVASYQVLSDAAEVAIVPGNQTSTVIELGGESRHYIQLQAIDLEGNRSNRSGSAVVDSPGKQLYHQGRESVNAPGWKWIPQQAIWLWWDGERYTERSVDATTPTSVESKDSDWRDIAVANGAGWFGLMLGVVSLVLLKSSLSSGTNFVFAVGMAAGGMSFVLGVIGLVTAKTVPRDVRSSWSKVASVLALVVGSMWVGLVLILILIADALNNLEM